LRLLRYCSNNINQYARKANETGSIYKADVEDIKNRQEELWKMMKELLSRLANI
ncbi:MAG: plasmid mobilization relaxosome protein MobC, partial [Erysipelotrichaceae bacterium]|nr:plasmid mobilization relaxosome protein MobC [Erysipelotrichaceae bacterium]